MKKHINLFLIILLAVFLGSCLRVKIWLDQSGIEDVANLIMENFKPESAKELESYLDNTSSLSTLQPISINQIQNTQLDQWQLEDIPIQRKITFPSTLKRSNGEKDTAAFYLYSNHELEGQNIILWIPGFGVSDLAFRFIKTFFKNELASGYAVMFYDIPYHLNRIEDGREMGEGLVTGNNQKNLELIEHVQYEIKTIINYLKYREVKSISGWGGSIGAAYLWLASESIHFEHMTLMIPIVDWTTLIFHERMEGVVNKMNSSGISEDLLRRAYYKVSPLHVPSLTSPDKIQILFARFDQFTPELKIMEFAEKWKIKNVLGFDESHASILINSEVYKENLLFLTAINKK